MEVETITTPPPADNGGGSGDETPKAEVKPDNTPAPEPKEEQKPAEARKFKLKFGKTEREVEEKEALALAQKGWASDEKFKAAKAAERKAQEIVDQADVEALLTKKYGKSKLEWAKEVLKEELRQRAMSPEEREAFDRKKRIEDLRAEEESLLKAKAERRMEEATIKYQEQYDREFAAALEKHKLPKNKYLMGRAVKIASEVLEYGEPDWDLVVGEAKRQVQEELAELIDQVSDGVGFLGEDRVRKLSKALVSRGVPAKEVAKIVKQIDGNKMDDKVPVDSESWWEKKRAEWSK